MSPLFRYSLKTTEKLWSSGIFRLYRKRVCAVLVSQLLTLSTFRLILSSRLYPVDNDVNWTYRRRSEDVQDAFLTLMYVKFTSCVHGGIVFIENFKHELHAKILKMLQYNCYFYYLKEPSRQNHLQSLQ